MKLTYGGDYHSDPLCVVGYSDSDWAANVDNRRSTTGYMFMLGGGPISWKSKSQPTVALLSTEAEYMALSSSAQEAIAFKKVCTDLGVYKPTTRCPILINEDNKGAIAMSVNPVIHQTSKHIDICCAARTIIARTAG